MSAVQTAADGTEECRRLKTIKDCPGSCHDHRGFRGNRAHPEEKTMLKITTVAIVLASAFTLPAFADDAMMATKCDNASMMKMQTSVDKMTDPMMKDKKAMASKEMMMAKDSMKAKKISDCKMHMDNAMKSMGNM
jgi:hypothetical protein